MIDLTAEVYGVELAHLEKIYYYSYIGTEELNIGDKVILNGDMGEEDGKIVLGIREMSFENIGYEPKSIIRKATDEDLEIIEKNNEDAKIVTEFTKVKAKELKLKMRVLYSKYNLNRTKLIIFFGADARVDFRELVKELAKEYRLRIELRQIGIRDEVKIRGSLGLCGQVACCARYKREFDSIKMELAKTQQMMINTAKISGRCGKLLCCLKYENDFYEEILKNVPYENTTIEYEGQPARVVTVNVFLKEVTLQIIKDNQPILLKIPFDYFNKTNKE